MLRDDKLEDLRRMYALFSRVPPTLDGVRLAMAEFVRASGRELVADQEQQKVWRDRRDRVGAVFRRATNEGGGCVCLVDWSLEWLGGGSWWRT